MPLWLTVGFDLGLLFASRPHQVITAGDPCFRVTFYLRVRTLCTQLVAMVHFRVQTSPYTAEYYDSRTRILTVLASQQAG
jgi:hypothetical protein